MKIFRYWLTVPLNTPWRCSFDVIPKTELVETKTQDWALKVEAVKKSGCRWEMLEHNETILESNAA